MGKLAMAALVAATLGTTACATYRDEGDRYGDYRYDGGDYADGDCEGRRTGLDPWLACTEEGREIVRLGFHGANAARRANAWFRRHADEDRDMCLTDAEIRTALANSALFQRGWRQRHPGARLPR